MSAPERMTLAELDVLEAVCAKATPGPWIRSGCRRKMGDDDCIMVGPDGFLIAALPIGHRPNEHAGAFNDAAHIAAMSPATAQRLIAMAREGLGLREALSKAESDLYDAWLRIDDEDEADPVYDVLTGIRDSLQSPQVAGADAATGEVGS